MQNQINCDKITLEQRKNLSMTGVEAVDGFSEQALRLTVSGNKVVITGENLKITQYNKATGNLLAEGLVNEIKFAVKKVPLVKKLFK